MRLSNGFVIDREKTFGELKFTAVRDVFLQNEDGTPSTQLKKRIYDLKCSLHGGIIPVSVPPEVPLREFPYKNIKKWCYFFGCPCGVWFCGLPAFWLPLFFNTISSAFTYQSTSAPV